MPTHNDYQVGWICALPLEFAAAEAMLDTVHETLANRRDDENTYVFGNVCQHNVVIACLPVGVYGTTSATLVGMQMRTSFPSLRFCLMVGVAGGAPGPQADIRLGDVVVSKPTGGYGGVIQYDYGKAVDNGEFILTGMLDKPPAVLLTALARLQARHHLRGNDIHRFYKEALDRYSQLSETFSCPGQDNDVLFVSDYRHVESGHNDCDGCDKDKIHTRLPRSSRYPRVFYGLVASANQVLRSAPRRDELSRRHSILCFEMEAAGLIDILPCLVIRGICDYCDSHKNKQWQGYASLAAAAYAKELLSVIPSNEVSQATVISDALRNNNNTPQITPSGSVGSPIVNNVESSYPKSINPGCSAPGSGNTHPITAEVSSSLTRNVDFLVGKDDLLVIAIDLGHQASRVAWATPADFKGDRINLIASWPGLSSETYQVLTKVGYKGQKVFWGYSIPNDTRAVSFLKTFRLSGKDFVDKRHNGRSAKQLLYDYIFRIYSHTISTINESTGNRRFSVQVVLVVPSDVQSRIKDIQSIVRRAYRSELSVARVTVILRPEAVALGALYRLPTLLPGAYVICDARRVYLELSTYKVASRDPISLEEISKGAEPCGWTIIDEAIDNICRQKLLLSSVHVNLSHLRDSVVAFREDILERYFILENPDKEYFIGIREIAVNGKIRDEYTCEPWMSRGRICLTEADIAWAFTKALNRIETLIDAHIGFRRNIYIQGIVLAGNLGSNPYVQQHMASVYTNAFSIPVFQEPGKSHLPPLRGALYKGFAGIRT